ncbi:MAG: flagellar hook-length control protein FliK [Tepidisphaerales bacterium]
MPITLAALRPTDLASPQPAGGGCRDADPRSDGSFGRMLDAASASAPASDRDPQANPTSSSDSPVVGEQGKERPQSDAAAKPQAQSQQTDSSQPASGSGKPKEAAPTIVPAQDPEPVPEAVDVKPAVKQAERAKPSSEPAVASLVAVPAPVQPAQTPEPQATDAPAASQPASPAMVQTGIMTQQAASPQAKSPQSLEPSAQVAAAHSPPLADSSAASAATGTEAFADGLEHALKKLDLPADADQPAQAGTPSALAGAATQHAAQSPGFQPVSQSQPAASPEPFVQANQGSIINGIRTQLLPDGGTMQIHLSPPELGAMQVRVEMRGEILAATFQTSNDQAAQMLTHSLGQLKEALEQQGVSVGRLQVVSAPRKDGAATGENSGQSATQWQGYQQQQNDQRREVLRQLWNRVAYGRDPIDLMA